MRLFEVGYTAEILRELTSTAEWCKRIAFMSGDDTSAKGEDWADIRSTLGSLLRLAENNGLARVFELIQHIELDHSDKESLNVCALEAQLKSISDLLVSDLYSYLFVPIPQELRRYVEAEHVFGEAVSKAFPSAIPDIKATGQCLAADCNTAAVFHAMRAVEWGLRALGLHLG